MTPADSVRWLTFAVIITVCVAPASADELLLKSGGQLEGQVLSRPSEQSDAYVVQLGTGIRVRLDAGDVGRVNSMTESQRRYANLLPDMPDTAAGHFTMAGWCHRNGLRDLKQLHLEYVLRHDPNHAEARKMLGYRLMRSQWMRPDEYMKSQGYERHRGSWRLPEQIQADLRQRETETAQKKWQGEIRRWRGWLKGRQRDLALQRLAAIDDPLATPALANLLAAESDVAVRLIFVDALAKMDNTSATAALITAALEDGDVEVRLRTIEHLRQRGSQRSIGPLVRALQSPNNQTVRRAGVALGRLGDRSAIRPLIDALVTTHTIVVKPRDSIRTGFGGSTDGSRGGGLSVGGGPKKVSRDVKNKSVLEALISLTGQNYRYASSEWKQWYIQQHALPDSVSLRRDS